MADNLDYLNRNNDKSVNDGIGFEIDQMVAMADNQRKGFERKWYDHNFFDDGYHFRYVSRKTGKIADLSDAGSANMPQRAIPKASRQIRGVANLLLSPKYVPVVFPDKVPKSNYQTLVNGQVVLDDVAYDNARQKAKTIAQKRGSWLEEEWRTQLMRAKLTLQLLLSFKNSVAFIKIWPDAENEKIKTTVVDAFDLYLMGNLSDIEDSPFVIECTPTLVSQIKANKAFNKEQVDKINPDNKYASSEIKQAYMQSRFGSGMVSDSAATLIVKEAWMKVCITEENHGEILRMATDQDMLSKKVGDTVMKHCFSAGGVWLLEEYLDLDEYPYVPYTFEPGPLYQKAFIENFIPANKSLDIVVSRLERWANTMVSGNWLVRKGEDIEITNIGGGGKIEYTRTPPVQADMTNVPPGIFNLIQFFNETIEEQGAATSALGQLPQGVKSGVAIESVKATEYANLEIPSEQLRNTIEKISRKMLRIADQYFMKPQDVNVMKGSEADTFSVIGRRGIDARQKLGIEVPQDVVSLSSDTPVRIEIESGLGFTMEGKKQTMQQIIDFMLKLVEQGILTVDAVKVLVERFMEVYQFGSTAEFMEAMDKGTGATPLNEEQTMQMKVAFLETLKDAGIVGPEADQKLVDSTKIGVVEALKDTGMLDQQGKQEEAPKAPSESISFKDLPAEGKAQMAAQAGIQLSPDQIEQDDAEKQFQVQKQKEQNAGQES